MSDMPLVTVGMPTYNRPDLFRSAFASVVNQTYPNIQIIVSDNASPTDQVERIVREESGDRPVKFFRQKAGLGPVGNFQFVLDQADGDYYMWLADDDWLDLDFVGACAQFLEEHPDFVMASGYTRYYPEGGQPVDGEVLYLEAPHPLARARSYFGGLQRNAVFYGLIRVPVLDKYQMKNRLGEDWILLCGLAAKGKIKMLSEVRSHRSLGGLSSKGAESLVAAHNLRTPAVHAMDEAIWNSMISVLWEIHGLRPWVRLAVVIHIWKTLVPRFSGRRQFGRYVLRERPRRLLGWLWGGRS